MGRPEAILIAGPTASGKSALALRLACALDGIVVNADSMQVYADLRIITARPSAEDEACAPHALFGTVDGATPHSVTLWLADIALALAAAREARRIPIIVGGTGLYFKALLQGLSDIPPVPDSIRSEIRLWAAGRLPEQLHAELAVRDPLTAAKLRPTDPQRVTRALEVHAATGESLATFQSKRGPALLAAERCIGFALTLERAALRERIDRRFEMMMAAGALDEVGRFAARNLNPDLPAMRAIGVPPLLDHLAGRIALAEAVARGQSDTRRYIKRQETFLRHQLPSLTTIAPSEADDAISRVFDEGLSYS
jgi:tRNA dimethylallyltransferase